MDPIITVNDKTLSFNQLAIDLLEVSPGDRIDIQYWMEPATAECIPVVAKADTFKTEGKKLTKLGTISYRGEQHDVLTFYGTQFILTTFKDGMFKLTSI